MNRRAWFTAGLLVAAAVPVRTATGQTLGRASAAALASARTKETSMREPSGPESVTLTADEMASLVEANLAYDARRALDSIRVGLQPGRLMLRALIVTSAIGEVLGPMTMMLDTTEPLAVAGPARAAKAGLITWQPDSVVIRSFAFPQAAIPRLVARLTGTSDGSIPIAVPPTVRRIWITPTGVTFSRKGS